MKCFQSRVIPAFLPIMSPSGRPTESVSLRFVQCFCSRKLGHQGDCNMVLPKRRRASSTAAEGGQGS